MWTAWNAFPMLDRLVDDVMNGAGGTAFGTAAAEGTFSPAIDVRANEEEIVFACDVPGLRHEDLDVTIESNRLTIKGRRSYAGGAKDRVWLGRKYGSFARTFTLPESVDVDRLSAELADGVLTVRIPKKPREKARRIEIGGASERQLDQKQE
jgi:HSP20 family protein